MTYIPEITQDPLNPGSILISGGIEAGSINAPAPPLQYDFIGESSCVDSVESTAGGGDVLDVIQRQHLTNTNGNNALFVNRKGSIADFDYSQATALIEDDTASAQDVLVISKTSGTGKALNVTGTAGFSSGIGRFGTAPPAAASAITGALSAVTDGAAKDVLTSIIAALLADGGATDGTT